MKRILLSICLFAVALRAQEQWVVSTMTPVLPYSYPYIMRFSGKMRDGHYSFSSASFWPYEMFDHLFPNGRAEYSCKILGKSGREYDGKVVHSWNDGEENPRAPGHEWGGWSGCAPIEEELVALRIYTPLQNSPKLIFEKKASPEPPVVEIKVLEKTSTWLWWDVAQNLQDLQSQPDIELTLDKGKSWPYSFNGATTGKDIANLLKPGLEATFRFTLNYDLRCYMKYYTLGKGFSDEAPADDTERPVLLSSPEAEKAQALAVASAQLREKTAKYGEPRIIRMSPSSGTTLQLKKGQDVSVRVVTSTAGPNLKVELNYADKKGSVLGTALAMQSTGNVYTHTLTFEEWPLGTWDLVVTVTTAKGMSISETGGTIQVVK